MTELMNMELIQLGSTVTWRHCTGLESSLVRALIGGPFL